MKNFDVIIDADNTLWDTDALYADAQLWLMAAVEDAICVRAAATDRLAFLRQLDQGIAEAHKAGLRYPTRLLVRGLESLLQENDLQRALHAALRSESAAGLSENMATALENEFYRRLSLPPSLRAGVVEGLQRLGGLRLVCLTEGSKAKCTQNLERLGLVKYFCRVVEARKSGRLFARLRRLTPNSVCVIGDQLSKDIEPARDVGLFTIYFPSNFRPRWESGFDAGSGAVIASFAEVPAILGRPT